MNTQIELAHNVPTLQVVVEADIHNLKSQSNPGVDILTAADDDCDCVEED